jgi:hypothetical protein
MGHVVLLGDSILDNAAYVSGGSPITEQLRMRLPRDWRVTILAKDGAIVTDIIQQLARIPEDATHLVVSAGGNDALDNSPLVNSPSADSETLLAELLTAIAEFQAHYRQLVHALTLKLLPTLVCTVYDAVPDLRPAERTILSLFNDTIVRESAAARFPILDLRQVCVEPRDFSSVSPIEPSEIGGSKISRAIQSVLLGHDFTRPQSVIYP